MELAEYEKNINKLDRICNQKISNRTYCSLLCTKYSDKIQSLPDILKIDVMHNSKERIDNINMNITYMNREYELISIVLGNGIHFITNFVDNGKYYYYNDMKKPEPIFQEVSYIPYTNNSSNYLLNCCFFKRKSNDKL